MKLSRKSKFLTGRIWLVPMLSVLFAVGGWGITEFVDSESFERLLYWIVLSLILVSTGTLLGRSLCVVSHETEPSLMETPLRLARDTEVFEQYRDISRSLLSISWQNDPIYRSVALQRSAKLAEELNAVAHGEIVFEGTETWRLVYEQLLRSPGLFQYKSVSRMTSDSYWQDEPGRRSLKLNIELHQNEQISVERIVIVKDSEWPNDGVMPTTTIRQWIHQQHVVGIWISLVRESQLVNEPELLVDFGIYGSRAVGTQQVDDQGKTVSFRLKFEFSAVEEAESRWKRLQIYATSYGDLLDHLPLDE